MNAPSQWETMLQCNVISHWLGPFTKWTLHIPLSCITWKVICLFYSLPYMSCHIGKQPTWQWGNGIWNRYVSNVDFWIMRITLLLSQYTCLQSSLKYKRHRIPKRKCFSSQPAVVFAQYVKARCLAENEDVVGAAPIGDAPTTSEWSTI